MKLLTGLFRFARKRTQTTDSDMGLFRDSLVELVEKKDTLSDEEISAKVDELKAMTADLPDEEEKAKLERFLEDFKSVKEQDEVTAKEAASMVADLFEKLDTAAMKDVPAVEETTEETVEEPAAETTEVVEETVAPESDAEPKDNAAEEEKPAEEEVKDDDNSDYTLEEIYQFIKKRMAEDAECKDDSEKVEEKKVEEVVADCAPRVTVTMNNSKLADGSIAAMFAKIKEGGR